MSTATTLNWDPAQHALDADPVATVALDRDAWIARGARFHPVADDLGDVTEIAPGTLALPGRTVHWAVLDHGQATSFLLVDGAPRDAESVIYELLAQHLLTPTDILERLPAAAPAENAAAQDVAVRLAALEHQVSDLRRTA